MTSRSFTLRTAKAIVARTSGPGYAIVTVPTVCLDEDVAEPVGMIKIDVEGHEASVLEGSATIMAGDRPRLMIEVEERHAGDAHRRVRERLGPAGYRRFILAAGALAPLAWDVDAAALQREPVGSPNHVNSFLFIHRDDALLHGSR